MKTLLLGLVALAALTIFPYGSAQADPPEIKALLAQRDQLDAKIQALQIKASPTAALLTPGAQEALDEVNAWRAARGLPAFIYDEGLTKAAASCALARAQALRFGHTDNDFASLPAGVQADAFGCAAYAGTGWLSCCMEDSYSHAGAAFVVGADGKRYMHLAVRGRSVTTATASASCANGSCSVGVTTRSRFRIRR